MPPKAPPPKVKPKLDPSPPPSAPPKAPTGEDPGATSPEFETPKTVPLQQYKELVSRYNQLNETTYQ